MTVKADALFVTLIKPQKASVCCANDDNTSLGQSRIFCGKSSTVIGCGSGFTWDCFLCFLDLKTRTFN